MRILSVLILATAVAGCAEVSPLLVGQKADHSAWESRQKILNELDLWTITGRVAVQTGEEGWSATLYWQQDRDTYTMRFIAPLGQGTYQLYGDGQQVSMVTADNKLFQAGDPESLLMDNLGWSVPLHGLRYWVRGVPEPGIETENIIIDDQGRMTDLQQSGWRISILRYTDLDGTDLPGKLFMSNDRFKLRIVVQDWKTKT